MLEDEDPVAVALFRKYKVKMPNMRLTDADVADLISFMESKDRALTGPGDRTRAAPDK
jgi:hypothetical protein